MTNTQPLKEYPTNKTPLSVLIDRNNLATRWSCSVMTIKRMEKRGELSPVYLAERIVRYRLQDIEAIEAAQ